jgi:hypothetical protein
MLLRRLFHVVYCLNLFGTKIVSDTLGYDDFTKLD